MGLKLRQKSDQLQKGGLQNLGAKTISLRGGRGNIRLFQCYCNTGHDGAKDLNVASVPRLCRDQH